MIGRLSFVGAAVAGLWLAAAAGGEARDVEIVDDFSCTTAAARKRWEPMAGSEGVSVVELAGRRALKMPVNFKGTRIERASWDGKVRLDLTMRKGVQFLFHCRDASPIANFSLYFHSGDGWYAGRFHGPASKGWTRVRVHKNATRTEGSPAGWGKVDTIRISAWRGGAADTEFHIAELAAFGAGGKVVVVRGDSAAATAPGEARGVQRYTAVMAQCLDRAGVSHAVLSDRDLTAKRLKGMKVVILPYNPAMPARITDEVAAFVRAGGKLLACYTLPRKLQELVGIRSGPHVSQEYKGHFASIRPGEEPLAGAPAKAGQASWNIHKSSPIDGQARVAAVWYSDKGESTRLPAILASDNGVFLTHVLLADDPAAKQRLLLAMVGHLAPELWKEAAAGHLAQVGCLEPYDGYEAARRGIRAEAAGQKAAVEALGEAEKHHARARALVGRAKYPEAMAAAGAAQDALVDAHCLAQRPLAGEHRAVWCHSAFGVAGMTWDQAVKNLADNGFTAVLPNMLWGGVAYYDSDVLPVAPEVKERGDQVALCAAACKKHGVQCHVWKVNWNMGSRTPREFVRKMKAAGRTQVTFAGEANDRWLCPSHPANRKLEIDAMVEVARKYDVAGVHFDYIRYPGRDGCFCKGCRERFEKLIGRKVAHWPADLRKDDALREKWLAFRREQITAVVAAVAERARKARPGVKISAAVFRNWPNDRDTIGQDWKVWCDRGYLDFACPMDYTSNTNEFGSAVERQLGWTGKVPCYPGIGASVWSDPTDVARLIAQIRAARRLGTKGFTIFNYDPVLAREVMPRLGKGITRKD